MSLSFFGENFGYLRYFGYLFQRSRGNEVDTARRSCGLRSLRIIQFNFSNEFRRGL